MCLLKSLNEHKPNTAQVTLLFPLSLALPQPQKAGNKVEVGFFFLLLTFSDVLHFYLLGSLLSDCWLMYQRSTPFNQVEFVGDLIETDHGVGGKVYILDQDTLVIDEFSFNNDGFGVYINVATKGRNKKAWAKNRIDVPYPSGRSHKSPIYVIYDTLTCLTQVQKESRLRSCTREMASSSLT